MHLLVVEDDRSIAEPMVEGLARAGFTVTWAPTGAEALAAVGADLVLLDLGLPDLDGAEVCRRLREASSVPVIVVSARADELDRVLLLELGADDYIVKPYGLRELVARVRAVARRTAGPGADGGDTAPTTCRVGPLVIDPRAHRASLDGAELDLTPKEFDLLAYLAAEPGRVFSRQRILEDVWATLWYGSTKTLDVHVASLRKKLGDRAWIATVRAVGFRLEQPGA